MIVKHKKQNSSRQSLDSLDSAEKPPLLNRHLYQSPRRTTFSQATCVPESEVIIVMGRNVLNIDVFQTMLPVSSETSLDSQTESSNRESCSVSSDKSEDDITTEESV